MFTHSQSNGMVSGTRNTVKPTFYGMKLLQGVLDCDGVCPVTFQEAVGSEGMFSDLLAVAVKRGTSVEIYIRNKSEKDVTIPIVRVIDEKNPDGKHRNVTVEGLFGKLDETAAHEWKQETPGDNAICKGLSITKITAA